MKQLVTLQSSHIYLNWTFCQYGIQISSVSGVLPLGLLVYYAACGHQHIVCGFGLDCCLLWDLHVV